LQRKLKISLNEEHFFILLCVFSLSLATVIDKKNTQVNVKNELAIKYPVKQSMK
jgi:hypothetical protein